jgi:DNA-binding beta-propeller fold protein YncE
LIGISHFRWATSAWLHIAPSGAIAYVACDSDDRLLVIDLNARKVVGAMPLGHDPDVLVDDPELKRLYVASESGVLSVFDMAIRSSRRSWAMSLSVTTRIRSRSVLLPTGYAALGAFRWWT